jgi:hypothetical protein
MLLTKCDQSEPVFICGEGRSGTKLLRDIISKNSNLFALNTETYFAVENKFRNSGIYNSADYGQLVLRIFTTMLARNKKQAEQMFKTQIYEDQIQQVTKDFLTKFPETLSFFECFNACALYLSQQNHKQRWVEKTPYHIYEIEKLINIFPNAKFIVVYRDPRAVIASWLKKDLDKSILGLIWSWNKVTSRILSLQKSALRSKIIFLSYETLIQEPETAVRAICKFLNEEFQSEMLDVAVVNSKFEDNSKKGFDLSTLERWKNILSPNQITLIEFLTQQNRKSLNYLDSHKKTSLFFVFLIALPIEILSFFLKKCTKLIKWFNAKS